MSFPLDSEHRITRSGEYRRVYDSGAKKKGRFLIFFVTEGSRVVPRAGITVSRKVGGACVRNRVKRRIKEALRLELEGAPVSDMVFVATRRIVDAGFEDIRRDIRSVVFSSKGDKRR